MTRLIIDTDPGVDDAHAVMAAFAHPDAQIEAITTVAGNVAVQQTTANACTILDVLGQNVPLYAGCGSPMVAHRVDAASYHGADGLGESSYPPSPRHVEDEHAVNALIRMANEAPGELTLVAIGPLTNVALAMRLDPALPHKFAQLVVMGGCVRGVGNITPAAEFNTYYDPEAAAVVLGAWPRLKLVPWEAAMDHPFSTAQVEMLLSIDSPRADFFRRITRHVISMNERIGRGRTLWAPDLLAVAVALEPGIAQQVETHAVLVELAGNHTRGHTTVDWMDRTGREPNVTMVLKVDSERLWEMMLAAVR